MIYDITAIFDFTLCIFSVYILVAILSKSRKKLYAPPQIRKRYITALIGFLSVPSLSIGAIIRVVTLGTHKDSAFIIFATLACIAMVITSIQFLHISKEKEISIKDALSEDIINN